MTKFSKTTLLSAIVLTMGLLAGCSDKNSTPETSATTSDDAKISLAQAQAIHKAALTVDAHADIELPGAPSAYVGEDG